MSASGFRIDTEINGLILTQKSHFQTSVPQEKKGHKVNRSGGSRVLFDTQKSHFEFRLVHPGKNLAVKQTDRQD